MAVEYKFTEVEKINLRQLKKLIERNEKINKKLIGIKQNLKLSEDNLIIEFNFLLDFNEELELGKILINYNMSNVGNIIIIKKQISDEIRKEMIKISMNNPNYNKSSFS